MTERYRNHALSGNRSNFFGCHIKPNLILIYRKVGAASLHLVGLGSLLGALVMTEPERIRSKAARVSIRKHLPHGAEFQATGVHLIGKEIRDWLHTSAAHD
ncbi:MAG: type II toxin-antitoxin system YafQ family toxin [Nitrosospira sp.]|nr:type II toxin-antitoxin system YafQ family toxin [Nitrosospira sp.]